MLQYNVAASVLKKIKVSLVKISVNINKAFKMF